MSAFIRTLALAAGLLAGGTLHAQATECTRGPADDKGIQVSVTTHAHPTRVAAALDSVLEAQGYRVGGSPSGPGTWSIAPRFTWLAEVESEDWHGDEHPGVQLSVRTDARRDSTHIELAARALCNVPAQPGVGGSVGDMVEIMSTTMLVAGVLESMDSLSARGIDVTTPVARERASGRGSVQAPASVAGFRTVSRHDYPDPRYGTNIRYGRNRDGLYVDIYVYPGTQVDSGCDAACAVNLEVDDWVAGIPEMVRDARYESLDVAGDDRLHPAEGAAWAYGRHLALKLRREGRMNDSHMWIYSFPGFFLKVRATYPPSPASAADVQAFVDELLSKLVPDGSD